ncbi:hypothetical protein [Taylorella equigenitalis]|uniref:hypothetical protein n=1 Tax=Taylorella equigenitalis TaxID=29575 RepID=UPI00237C799C|nr:hypothetical protein [Taylorella equigenitalis]WDU54208.1 hypothetical protein KPZ19_04290 [Taylorella equigenitalis]
MNNYYEYLILILDNFFLTLISLFFILFLVTLLLFRFRLLVAFLTSIIFSIFASAAIQILALTGIDPVKNITRAYLSDNGGHTEGVFYKSAPSGTTINDRVIDDYYIIYKTEDGQIIDTKTVEINLDPQKRNLFTIYNVRYLKLDPTVFEIF